MPWGSSWPQETHGEAVKRARWGSTGQRPHPTSTDGPCTLPTRTTKHTNCHTWPHPALCHGTLSAMDTREKAPPPQDQHFPSFQGIPQPDPTCTPELPPVPLLARTSGPSNPGTELGPTYTHLPPSARPCLLCSERSLAIAVSVPCASGREPVRVSARPGQDMAVPHGNGTAAAI